MTSYDPVMMVSPKEFKALVEYYKGNITESTLLNEAARVAAETRVLMENTKIDPALKEPQLKELMRKRTKLARKLRESAGDVASVSTDQNLDSLQERLLKGVASSVSGNVAEAGDKIKQAIEQQQQQPVASTPLGKKRKFISPIVKKESPKTPSSKPGPSKVKRKRKTEVEKLKEDQKKWESWDTADDDDDSDDYQDTREDIDDDEEDGDSD